MSAATLFSWSYWVQSIVGGVHFAAALLALGLGPVIFLKRKADRFHRLAGYVWVLAMLVVNISALTHYDLTGRPNLFHFFALWSLSALLPGFYAIQRAVRTGRRKDLELHIMLMIWAYFGLAAAGYSQIASRVLVPWLGSVAWTFAIIGLSVGVCGMVLGRVCRRHVPRMAERYQLSTARGPISFAEERM